MKKTIVAFLFNEKIYRVASICNFVLHTCVFVFVLAVGFLPFHGELNFYDCFIGFFGQTLSAVQPYFIMAILLLSCVGAFFAIERPWHSFFVAVCSFSFFVIAFLPYAFEAAIVGFVSPWIGASMSTYGIGFDLIGAVSNIIYFDVAFFVYSVITLFIGAQR